MSFIQSQVTHGGIVMAADRYAINRIFNPEKTNVMRFISTGHIHQKLYVTKHNMGIACCGDATVNNTSIERYIYDFIYEMDIEKLNTPYEVAKALLEYFKKLNPKLNTDFHVGGYDTTGNKINPCIYNIIIDQNICSKVNQDQPFSGAIFNSPCEITGKIFDYVGKHYADMTLGDAVEFAKFVHRTTKDAMRFKGSNEAMSREMDILIIKPTGVEKIEA